MSAKKYQTPAFAMFGRAIGTCAAGWAWERQNVATMGRCDGEMLPQEGLEMQKGIVRRIIEASSLLVSIPLQAASIAPDNNVDSERTVDSSWLSPATVEQAQAICADENVAEVLWIDGELHASCAYAFGDRELREQNRLDRRQRILRVRASGRNTDILYHDAKLREPLVRTLEGISLTRAEDARVASLPCDELELLGDAKTIGNGPEESIARLKPPQRETVAWATLTPPFDSLCAAGPYPMRQDDALGAEAHVVHLGRAGALTMYRGELLWVPYQGESIFPSLRMVWRSDFQVIYETGGKNGGSAPKSKKKRSNKTRARR